MSKEPHPPLSYKTYTINLYIHLTKPSVNTLQYCNCCHFDPKNMPGYYCQKKKKNVTPTSSALLISTKILLDTSKFSDLFPWLRPYKWETWLLADLQERLIPLLAFHLFTIKIKMFSMLFRTTSAWSSKNLLYYKGHSNAPNNQAQNWDWNNNQSYCVLIFKKCYFHPVFRSWVGTNHFSFLSN